MLCGMAAFMLTLVVPELCAPSLPTGAVRTCLCRRLPAYDGAYWTSPLSGVCCTCALRDGPRGMHATSWRRCMRQRIMRPAPGYEGI